MDVENISVAKLLLKMSPPVMLALLIQSIYTILQTAFLLQNIPQKDLAHKEEFVVEWKKEIKKNR